MNVKSRHYSLAVPECLDVGQCLVGGIKVGRFTIKNKGGPGRFCLVPVDEWPNPSFEVCYLCLFPVMTCLGKKSLPIAHNH